MNANRMMTGTLECLRHPLVANIARGLRILIATDTRFASLPSDYEDCFGA